ncbi:hypothetical protein HA402_014052 [Bradysia odoriphaga]|nr:hypothetical protein HA402_014052 [Bradysia odoriphaga]
MNAFERVVSNNNNAEELLASLNAELNAIKNEKIQKLKAKLTAENANLVKQVELAKEQLIKLETLNGKVQIPIPRNKNDQKPVATKDSNEKPVTQPVKPATDTAKPAKEKKPKAPAAAKESAPELPVDFGRLDFRVGKIVEVSRHPDAESLYLEKIDCGEPQLRTVVSGLVKFVPLEEMQNRMVIVMCNLKPAKMRGVTSEAMVMCASTPEKVEVLSPPPTAVPGDLVHCDGFVRNPEPQLNPKKKVFETCAPDLTTNDSLQACYKGTPWNIPGKGFIVSQTLKNVNVK